MTKARWAVVFLGLLISSLCTGSILYGLYHTVRDETPEETAARQTREGARAERVRQSGHYSARDGRVRFVLDQTGAPKKLAFDGSSDVFELREKPYLGHSAPKQVPSRVLVAANRKHFVVSAEDGSIELIEPSASDGGSASDVASV